MPRSLTEHLTNLTTSPSYSEAINHPFLIAAGSGILPDNRLALWLSQDRIYAAHAYPLFIGALITSIPFDPSHRLSAPEEQRNQGILQLLAFCLDNIVQEVNFFRDTAEKWALPLEGWRERKGTKDYTAEMARVSKNGRIEDGLIFLWAMERVYLDAWSYVARQLGSSDIGQPNAAVGSFASNWSSPDFVKFVDRLAVQVDNLKIEPDSDAWKRAEAIWARVVELEVDFWPKEGEEISQHISQN